MFSQDCGSVLSTKEQIHAVEREKKVRCAGHRGGPVIARSERRSNPSFRCTQAWIAHMGNVCVKDEQSPFCLTAATFSSRPRAVQDGARRSSQGRPLWAAAQRLGLDLIEHAIMLGRVGTRQRLLVLAVRSGHLQSSHLRSKVRAGSAIWVACQIKLTFGRRARRLHQDSACGGQAREDEAILRCGV